MPLLDPLSSVTSSLRKANLIPNVIPEDFQPSTLFSVTWGTREVLLGNELSATDVQDEPAVTLTPMVSMEEDGGNYTIALVGPDDSSSDGLFRHWLQPGLVPHTASEIVQAAAANTLSEPLAARPTKATITQYTPPVAQTGTKNQTYVFLLFKEPVDGLSLTQDAMERKNTSQDRRNWSPMKFAQQNKLTLVGANYFILTGAEKF